MLWKIWKTVARWNFTTRFNFRAHIFTNFPGAYPKKSMLQMLFLLCDGCLHYKSSINVSHQLSQLPPPLSYVVLWIVWYTWTSVFQFICTWRFYPTQATLKAKIGRKEVETMVSTSEMGITHGKVCIFYCSLFSSELKGIFVCQCSLCEAWIFMGRVPCPFYQWIF